MTAGAYFNLKNAMHALCGARILRELTGLIDKDKSKWAQEFKSFLISLYETPFEARVKRRSKPERRYDEIMALALADEPPPYALPGKRGRMKRTKGINLAEPLAREKNAMLAFSFHSEVPFTNNLVERDLRPTKVKQRVSNCFRTTKDAEISARI